ncbi:MAG: bifunctional methylenetetrahydrofolate dehydrogenase/methenyltetrahydrofolate cyclohydrolase FolD [Oscillospiraceae bacterium]|nr:bifunctional methylenetetrahydrofolate dehydrogenase/methenyltetrahydrofolate cyclohydrolase FolD [Oscillospiraceae bacterium]
MQLIDGKLVASKIKEQLKLEVEQLKQEGNLPGLAVILVGDDSASAIYVRNKTKACEELGIYAEKYILPESTTQEELLDLIHELNVKKEISGILVQLPLPKHFDEQEILHAIEPDKDVDCFHPWNVGRVMIGDGALLPCTPAGIVELLDHYGIEIAGKDCVVVGRSNIVGKPIAMMLLSRNATVNICHSKTKDLKAACRNADIIVSATGCARLITGDMVKEGAVIIDVGMNRSEGKLCGDVDFATVSDKASYVTPVPGGVGPMTITMLMKNTIQAAKTSNSAGRPRVFEKTL